VFGSQAVRTAQTMAMIAAILKRCYFDIPFLGHGFHKQVSMTLKHQREIELYQILLVLFYTLPSIFYKAQN
jgi:hypothetical protein